MEAMKMAIKKRRMAKVDPTDHMESGDADPTKSVMDAQDPDDEEEKSGLAPELSAEMEDGKPVLEMEKEITLTPDKEQLLQKLMDAAKGSEVDPEELKKLVMGDDNESADQENLSKIYDEGNLKGPPGIMQKAAMKMKAAMSKK